MPWEGAFLCNKWDCVNLLQVKHQQGNPALNPAEGPSANVYLVYITAADCVCFYKMLCATDCSILGETMMDRRSWHLEGEPNSK